MVVLNDKFIEIVSSFRLEIDFIEIRLIQQATDNPIVYSGPGSIFQTQGGGLELKMYHKYKSPSESVELEFENFLFSKTEPGN
jgi:hypothetical protein